MCRSFESWQRIIGINAAFILADEIDTVAKPICDRAFPKILGRLRAGNVRQFAAASTPEGYKWFWQTFGSDEDDERVTQDPQPRLFAPPCNAYRRKFDLGRWLASLEK